MDGRLLDIFLGRLLGSGVSWLAVLIAAALGNAANTLLLDSVHRSIGASTAVFATLGVLAGYVWRARLMAQDRWPTRFGAIVGGIALLMFTGTARSVRRRQHRADCRCGCVDRRITRLKYARIDVEFRAGADSFLGSQQ